MIPNAPGTQGHNPYAYAANNPTAWTDPSGHTALLAALLTNAMEILGNPDLAHYACMRSGWACLVLFIVLVFATVICILWGECRELLDDYQGLMEDLASRAADELDERWGIDRLDGAEWEFPAQPTPGGTGAGGSRGSVQLPLPGIPPPPPPSSGGGGSTAGNGGMILFDGPCAGHVGPRIQDDIDRQRNSPTPPLPRRGGSIGSNPAQNAQLQLDMAYADQILRASDMRVNQEQVSVAYVRVGINRPDLQYTYSGQRYYVEYDSPPPIPPRSLAHRNRICSNDPLGWVALKVF